MALQILLAPSEGIPARQGVFGADGKQLYLEKPWLRAETQEITVTVPAPPARAGVDPLHKLIDRKPGDNIVRVDTAS